MSAPIWSKLLTFFPTLLKGNSGAGPAVNWPAGSVQSLTLNAATVTPTFAAPVGGADLALLLTQDGVGGRAVVWPAAVSWIGGTAPILLSGANQTTLVYFYWDGTTYWGSLASGASPSSIIPWTDVAAGTALAASLARPNLSFDSSGAQSSLTLPTAANLANSDGFEFTIKLTGAMVSPVIVTAGAGTTVELLNAPGTFGASTWMAQQGRTTRFKYDKATTSWKAASTYASSGAPGTSGYNPGWYAAGTIFIDPQNTSGTAIDSNAGTSSGAALRTYAECVRRWGSVSPSLSVSTSLTFLSSHTDNTDPVIWSPIMSEGTTPSIQGAAPATTAAVFTRAAQKNRAAGANSLLAGSFSAGAPAQGVMVQNTTAGKSSRAFIYKTAGGANWNISQPMTLGAVPNAGAPTEVDTWASLDTVTLSSPIGVNVAVFNPTIVDMNGSFNNFGQLYQLTCFDPQGAGNDPMFVGGGVVAQECVIQREVCLLANDALGLQTFNQTNCANLGGLVIDQGTYLGLGGFLAGSNAGVSISAGRVILDGDFILGISNAFGAVQASATAQWGLVYIDATQVFKGGTVTFAAFDYGSHVVYGSAAANLNFEQASRGLMATGTFTAGWTAASLVTGCLLNNAALGNSAAYAGNVATIHNGITTSVANLDAAAGAAGFGGTAFNLGGAQVSNAL
jgi:hypothetical protein